MMQVVAITIRNYQMYMLSYRWLKKFSVILLLNKQDKLRAKVLEGRFKIETYFPQYSTYQLIGYGELIVLFIYKFTNSEFDSNYSFIQFTDMSEPGENEEVRRAKGFIRDLFVVSINIAYLATVLVSSILSVHTKT